jgi:hypothetical protein
MLYALGVSVVKTMKKLWDRAIKEFKRGWGKGGNPKYPTETDPVPEDRFYLVEPVIMVASDDVIYFNWPKIIKERFEEVSEWWRMKTSKSFRVGQVKIHQSTLTREQLLSQFHENELWDYLQEEADAAGVINNFDDHRTHYAIIPHMAAGGGMRGSEHFGATHILPGKACISGKEALVLLNENPTYYGFPAMPDHFDEQKEATGAIAHELGHMFGNGVDQPLVHSSGGTIMFNYWDYPHVGFSLEEISELNGSPFLT